jgi:hypothetical protein
MEGGRLSNEKQIFRTDLFRDGLLALDPAPDWLQRRQSRPEG